MATRFRLTNTATDPGVNATLQSYSHNAPADVRRNLVTTDASTLTDVAYTPDGADHLVAGDALHCQFTTVPLDAGIAFTNGDVIKFAVQGLEAGNANNLTIQLWVGVYDSAGTTLRRELRSKVSEGTELATTLANRFLSTTQSGATYTTVANDRLVVEFSVVGTPTASGGTQGHNATLRWGGSGAGGDLAENDTETGTTFNPWIEFVPTIFATPATATPATVAGVTTFGAPTMPPPPFIRQMPPGTSTTTSCVVTVDVAVPAGELLFVRTLHAGVATAAVNVTAITDSRGNTYTQHTDDNGFSGGGEQWSAPITTALQVSDTITLTAANVDSVTWVAIVTQFTGLDLGGSRVLGSQQIQQGSVTTEPVTVTASIGTPPFLVVGTQGLVTSAFGTYTEDSDTAGGVAWSGLPDAVSSPFTLKGQYRTPTSDVTQTFNPSWTNASFSNNAIIVFRYTGDKIAPATTIAATTTLPAPTILAAASVDIEDEADVIHASTEIQQPTIQIVPTPQLARPDGTISAGSWTDQAGGTTNIWNTIDESVASDADYVRSGLVVTNDELIVTLTDKEDPVSSTGHVVRFRYRKS